MNYGQIVLTVAGVAFVGTYAGEWLYWRTRGRWRGLPKPLLRSAIGEAVTAAIASALTLAIPLI